MASSENKLTKDTPFSRKTMESFIVEFYQGNLAASTNSIALTMYRYICNAYSSEVLERAFTNICVEKPDEHFIRKDWLRDSLALRFGPDITQFCHRIMEFCDDRGVCQSWYRPFMFYGAIDLLTENPEIKFVVHPHQQYAQLFHVVMRTKRGIELKNVWTVKNLYYWYADVFSSKTDAYLDAVAIDKKACSKIIDLIDKYLKSFE